MKKIIYLLSFLLIINLFIHIYLIFNKYSYSTTDSAVYVSSDNITDNYNLISSILKDTKKESLIQYIDYINITNVDSIPNDINNKTAFVLSLPNDVSFIAFYDKISSSEYSYSFHIDNLNLVNNFYFYKDFLIIEQSSPAKSSEFDTQDYVEIFYLKDNTTSSVFKRNLHCETTIEQEDNFNNTLLKSVESTSIDYLDGDESRIICVTTTTIYEVDSKESDAELKEIKQSTKKEILQWDYEKETFILVTNA